MNKIFVNTLSFTLIFAWMTFNIQAQQGQAKTKARVTAPSLKANILTIGDSNGAHADGWVTQLRKVLPAATIINQSVSGNTIGFDNLGHESLNTLKNIDRYIKCASDSLNGKTFDYVIVCLGTNDCKAEFANRQKEVIQNMNILVTKIENHPAFKVKKPHFIMVSPPPYGDDKMLLEKYKGGDKRVSALIQPFHQIATRHHWKFIDIYKMLRPDFNNLTPDGIHMKAEGQMRIARMIVSGL